MPDTLGGCAVLCLFEQYYERVYCFARRSLDQPTAEDIAQEVFVRLMNIPNLESRTINASYLIKIADNLIKRRHRRQRRFETIAAEQSAHWRSACVVGPDRDLGEGGRAVGHDDSRDGWSRSNDRLGVDEPLAASESSAWEGLTDGESDAVRLVVCGGLSYENAARSLNVKVSTLNNWKFRGIKRLKEHVDRSPDQHGPRDRRELASRGERR